MAIARPGLIPTLFAVSIVATPAEAGKRDNSIRFANDQQLASVVPSYNSQRLGPIIGHHVWDTLIHRDPKTGEYHGQLATAWRWIDGKTLELDLRQGVKFHNGAELDTDDVVFTLNYVSKPENKAIQLYWIDQVERLDKYK